MAQRQETGSGGKLKAILLVTTVLKYGLSLALLVAGTRVTGTVEFLLAGVLEVVAIAILTNWLTGRFAPAGYLVNGALMLVLNFQAAMLVFASSYVTPIMLSNLFNLEDLAGQAQTYTVAVAAVVVASLLPVTALRVPALDKAAYGIGVAALVELVALLGIGVWAAPIGSAIDLKGKWDQYNAFLEQSAAAVTEGGGAASPEMVQAYYRETIPSGRERPVGLPDQPNVIVIFTEGLSQSIVDDERGIMPNVARYEETSLSFVNYYNHTAATYRGVNGQLYSGFQLNDFDANSLISLQSILDDRGYSTTFINPEPEMPEWCEFLDRLGFQEVVSTSSTGTYSLKGNKMSDYEAYQTLQAVVEDEAQSGNPFLVCIYTFGTHATYDSPDVVFGNGADPEVNKFYNCDYQFGQFMDWFEQSGLADDTIVVFTADHATYRDLGFMGSFPYYEREHYFLDAIPCFFYYAGVEAEQVDVGGRNSLDFTPTLLDYLDVSAPNCFMGESLFLDPNPVEAPEEGLVPMDMVYFDGMDVSTTSGSDIDVIDEDADEYDLYMEEIMDYVAVSRVPLEA